MNNETSESLKINPFLNYVKKYMGINMTKEVKDLYAKDYKILIKKFKDDSKKWKGIPQVLGLEELTLLKFPYYPKQSTGLI